VLARLEADGLVRSGPEGARTTARWQAAMARAALRLYRNDAPWQDLRLPIAAALLECSNTLSDPELADLVEAMLPIEQRELGGARSVRTTMKPQELMDSAAIDARYGLEPVFEPGVGDRAHPTEFVAVQCPYCGETFATEVDLSSGSFRYVEDCQVCCQPIELAGEVDAAGALGGLSAERTG